MRRADADISTAGGVIPIGVIPIVEIGKIARKHGILYWSTPVKRWARSRETSGRASVHYYNTEEEIKIMCEVLVSLG